MDGMLLQGVQLSLRARFRFHYERFQRGGGIRYLDEAILLLREAIELYPQGQLDRSTLLNNLATCLWIRYNQLGAVGDLEQAIVLNRKALELCLPGHPHHSCSLNNLASCLRTRYNQLGAVGDLEQAIILHREALALRPPGHPHRSSSLNNLATCLSTRYDQFGAVGDVEQAIFLHREALELCPPGHPDRSASLINLASCLLTRYDQLGAVGDLEKAIVLHREALELRPPGHPRRSTSLNNLASCLETRYDQLGAVGDLDQAIMLNQETLELCPPGHPDRATSLINLASCLSTRYDQLGAVEDLEQATLLQREALELCPPGHPDRSSVLINLASYLKTRYDQLGTVEDLEQAILLSREALELRPHGNPYRSAALQDLVGYLRTRFTRSEQAEDKEALFNLYLQLVDIPQMVSPSDLSAARSWIRVAEDFHHPSTVLAYETSLRLLVEYLSTLPSLPRHLDLLKKATSSLAVDAFSACLRNKQGRGVFWSQLPRLRLPLDDVIASGAAGTTLAYEFSRLTSDIRSALNSSNIDQHDRLYHLNSELKRLVNKIRELPGLSHFLLPLPFSDLQRAASGGPVVIVNASQHGCDAVVVLRDRYPVHIPLRITREHVRDLSSKLRTTTIRAKSMDITRDLGVILRELWDRVVSHVVDFLQRILARGSRIWWCPTAEFSLLPLHAAGPYRKGQRNLGDLYISSYTPTLSALIRARQEGCSISVSDGKRFIAIGQANAMGQSELPSVSTELTYISQRVHHLAIFTQIEGPTACISRVVEELKHTQWVHLACHGIPNPKQPFESAFALHDGRFTIERIIRCDLENPEFVYLSACHTTVGDEESPDEVIHLAATMQFAGFRSVIGTMWAVDDAHTNQITSTFYRYMVDESGRLDHTRAAHALNKTMKSVDIPHDQRILYIHLGLEYYSYSKFWWVFHTSTSRLSRHMTRPASAQIGYIGRVSVSLALLDVLAVARLLTVDDNPTTKLLHIDHSFHATTAIASPLFPVTSTSQQHYEFAPIRIRSRWIGTEIRASDVVVLRGFLRMCPRDTSMIALLAVRISRDRRRRHCCIDQVNIPIMRGRGRDKWGSALAHPASLEESHFEKVKRPLLLSCSEDDFTFPLEARRRAEDILVANKTGYFIQVFSGVAHGFAIRGNMDVPDERWAKEESARGIKEWFLRFSA
ncbi:CHAT domain containing protein [Tylopilus felleus]